MSLFAYDTCELCNDEVEPELFTEMFKSTQLGIKLYSFLFNTFESKENAIIK